MVAILMIPLFLLFLVVLILGWVLGIVLATIIGLFCGPVMFLGNTGLCRDVCCCLCLLIVSPILMAIGAIAGFFTAWAFGGMLVCTKIIDYWSLFGKILCNPEDPNAVDQPG